jgi:hypothetical protein
MWVGSIVLTSVDAPPWLLSSSCPSQRGLGLCRCSRLGLVLPPPTTCRKRGIGICVCRGHRVRVVVERTLLRKWRRRLGSGDMLRRSWRLRIGRSVLLLLLVWIRSLPVIPVSGLWGLIHVLGIRSVKWLGLNNGIVNKTEGRTGACHQILPSSA